MSGFSQDAGALAVIKKLQGKSALQRKSQTDAETYDDAQYKDCGKICDKIRQDAGDDGPTERDYGHLFKSYLLPEDSAGCQGSRDHEKG